MPLEFPGVSDEKLAAAIVERGGKLGVLDFLRTNFAELAGNIIEQVTLGIDEELSKQQLNKIKAICARYGTNSVIIRTSHHSDWERMVDAMPTERDVLLDKDGFVIQRCILEITEKCRNQSLINFAQKEGSDYDPGHVTIGIAPYLEFNYATPITMTEHPNHKEVRLMDVVWHPKGYTHPGQFFWNPYDFVDGQQASSFGNSEEYPLRKSLGLMDDLRETGLFGDNHSLQYEALLLPSGKPLLVQVRQFAKFQQAEEIKIKKTKQDYRCDYSRIGHHRSFGIFEGVLPISYGASRQIALHHEEKRPGVEYAYSPSGISEPPKLNEVPEFMKVYVPSSDAPALGHNQTRYVKYALQNNGAAILEEDEILHKIAHWGEDVHIVVNGKQYLIEKA